MRRTSRRQRYPTACSSVCVQRWFISSSRHRLPTGPVAFAYQKASRPPRLANWKLKRIRATCFKVRFSSRIHGLSRICIVLPLLLAMMDRIVCSMGVLHREHTGDQSLWSSGRCCDTSHGEDLLPQSAAVPRCPRSGHSLWGCSHTLITSCKLTKGFHEMEIVKSKYI